MAISEFTLTGNISELVGDAVKGGNYQIRVYDGPKQISYTVENEIRVPGGRWTIPTSGLISKTLPHTNITGSNPETFQYEVLVTAFVSGGGKVKLDPIYVTAEVGTTTVDLADALDTNSASPTWMSAAIAQLQEYVTDGETIRDETQNIRDGIVGDLTTTDSQVATLATPGSGSLLEGVLSATIAAAKNSGGHYYFEKFVTGPVDTTGATDYSTELAAAHTAIAAFGGGTLEFPTGTLKFLDRSVLPNDGASSYPRQQALRWIGQGSYSDPKGGSGPYPALAGAGGTILDFRYAGRLDTATVTNGSATVADTSITADDSGLQVFGTGIPAGAFIYSVTPGVSFKLSSNPRSQVDVLATSSGTSVRVGLPKIDTRGKGKFDASGLTITDQGTSSNPFFHTTNTNAHIHDVAFSGNPTKSGATCDQDAIILGGTNLPTSGDSDNKPNGPFQGYGTIIENCHFDRIRRAVLMQLYCNGSVFRNNNIWITCGTNLALGACIELAAGWGGGTSHVFGNVIEGNLIECSNYVYPIKLDWAQGTTIAFNNFYDGNPAVTLAYVRFSSNQAKNNLVLGGYGSTTIPLVSEASAGLNTWRPFEGSQLGQEVTVPVWLGGMRIAGRNSAVAEVTYATATGTGPAVWTGTGVPPTTGTGFAAAKRGSLWHATNNYPGTTLWLKESDGTGSGIVALGPHAKIPIRTITATTVAIDGLSDRVVLLNNGSGCTATLPTAVLDAGTGVNTGKRFTIKNINATSATIATTSSQTIDGATTKTLAQWEKVTVISDGANWFIIG